MSAAEADGGGAANEPPAAPPPVTPSPSRPRRWPRRLAVGALVALVLVASSWYTLFFWAKSTGRLEQWAGRRPDRFQLSWSGIRSPLPFVFEATDVTIAARSARVRWRIEAERVRVAVAPLALLDRRFHVRRGRVSGATFRLAREALRVPAEGAPSPALPPLPAFAEPRAAPAEPKAKPWSWVVEHVAFAELREVWVDELRVTGRGEGELTLALERRERAEVGPSRLRVESATVRRGDDILGERVGGEVTLQIVPWRYRGASAAEVSRHAQGRLALVGRGPVSLALAYLFGERPWLQLAADVATFDTALEVDRGRVRSGSRLRATLAPTLAAFGFVASGPAELVADVEGERDSERLESTLTLGVWSLARPAEGALFRGEGLRVDARSETPRTDRAPSSHRLVLDLGRGRADDLRFVNAYLPAAAGAAVTGGTLALGGQLRFDSGDGSGSGEIALTGDALALDLRGERFSADLAADLRLSEPDLAAGSFSLAGSKLALRDVAATATKGTAVARWSGEVELPSGRLALRQPFAGEGQLALRADDTRPLIAFYELRRDLPSWAERALLVDDVRLTGRFRLAPGRFELRDARLPLPNGEARAELELAKNRRHARLLLSWRRLDLGIELRDGERDLHLLRAREWFERSALR